MTKTEFKTKQVHQVKLWGTPFTLTYRYYDTGSKIGDVHARGVVVYRNINLQEFLERQYGLRALARQAENKKSLRRARKEGRGYVPVKRSYGARPTPGHPVQVGYVVTEESPVRYVEENGCLRPLGH